MALDQVHPLDGARERLKRADENIQNLNRVITDFLSGAPTVNMGVYRDEPIITDENRHAFEELKAVIREISVPPRFSVLTGEIIHHLRSAFDHVAWQLSSPNMQANSPRQIQFPVFDDPPIPCGVKRKQICSYCRQIEGISSPTALARIHGLQPYLATNPQRHPLWLIHDMDIHDKHRELILAIFVMHLNIIGNVEISGHGIQMPWETVPRKIVLTGEPKVNMEIKMAAQITLREFSGRDDESIIPTLQNLLRFTTDSVNSFAEEFA